MCSPMALLNRLFDKCFGLSKMERKYLLAPGETSFVLVSASNICCPLKRAAVSAKYLFTGLGWGEKKHKPIVVRAKF